MAKKQGQQAVCQNNLRQTGLAAAMYADDYDVERVSSINTLPEQEAIDQELEMWRFRKQ